MEADAVSDPWTVMVHLEDTGVALRTMVRTVRLCLVAPLANSNAAKLFLLVRDYVGSSFGVTRVLTSFFAVGLLLVGGQKRPSCCHEILDVLVLLFGWIAHALFYS